MRPSIVQKLIAALPSIKSGKVFRGILWILGEYVEDGANIEAVMAGVRKVIGEIPIGASEQRALDEANEETGENGSEKKEKVASRPKVLADGTYATETAYTSSSTTAKLVAIQAATKPPLRSKCFQIAIILVR